MRRNLTIYIAQDEPFPHGVQFIVYWHTDDPENALIDPFFYEHAARNDLERKVWIAPHSGQYDWSFLDSSRADGRFKAFLQEIETLRWRDLQAFFGQCWTNIEKNPNRPFQMTFR